MLCYKQAEGLTLNMVTELIGFMRILRQRAKIMHRYN